MAINESDSQDSYKIRGKKAIAMLPGLIALANTFDKPWEIELEDQANPTRYSNKPSPVPSEHKRAELRKKRKAKRK